MRKFPIIHITGAPAAGKSYLADKLRAELGAAVVIIDTDEIDDYHALQLLTDEKNRILLSKSSRGFMILHRKRQRMNHKWINPILKERTKPIIIVGISFSERADPARYATYKFYISIDTILLWKRGQIRALELFERYRAQISELIESNMHPNEIKYRTIHQYKIRHDIIGPFDETELREDIALHRRNKYRITDADTIYTVVVKMIYYPSD